MKDLSGLEVKDYFRILWNRRWYFLIVFALVSTGGVFSARQKPDIYRSEAKITVDVPLSAITRTTTSSVQERIGIIREHLSSRTFVEKMIQQTGMYGWGTDGFVMERAVRSVRGNLRVDSASGTLIISFRATDPHVAQNVTNQLTREVIRASTRTTRDRTMVADRFAEERFNTAGDKLREKSAEISLFKQRNAGKLPEQTVANMNAVQGYRQRLDNVESAIAQMKSSKELRDMQLNDMKALQAQLDLINMSSASTKIAVSSASSPEEIDLAKKMESLAEYEAKLAQALTRYTGNHPDVRNLAAGVDRLKQEVEEARKKYYAANAPVTTVDDVAQPVTTRATLQAEWQDKQYEYQVRTYEADLAKLEKQRDELMELISDYEARLKFSPTLVQELEELLREEALLQRDYESAATQKLNAELATAVETDRENEVYRIVDEANVPTFPESPNRAELIMIALGVGLLTGLAAAFGRELLDSTVSSEEEAKKVFNLPVLAAIPSAPKKSKKAA